jgi:hypothetical protein
MYNIIDDDVKYDDWKKIDVENRRRMAEEYMKNVEEINKKDIGVDLRENILQAIEGNKILYKKDITYDKINGKIMKLNGLEYKNGEYEFGIVPVQYKKKNLVTELLRK